MLLDGSDADRRMIERMLGRGTGRYTFEHATTHQQALEILAESRIDLVVMDVVLSDLPGPEAIVMLQHKHRGVPVIVVTEHTSEGMLDACSKAGADEVVPKLGIDRKRLTRAVDASLANLYRMRAREVVSRADHASKACYALVGAVFDGGGPN